MELFRRETYSDQVVYFIKQCILSGELIPGDQVKEVMLSERLGISRAPIREALQLLTQEGLLVTEPQKGKRIRALSCEEIRNDYDIGGILEGAGVAMTLADMTEADIAALDAIVEKMRALAPTATGLSDLAELDEEFHAALLHRCPNRRLADMARTFCAVISKFLLYNHWNTLFPPEEFVERHQRILDAVLTRDPETLERIVRNHYRESGSRMARFGSDAPKPDRK